MISLARKGFYDRNPGADISIEQMTLNPPTENSKGLRLGSFVLIRDIIEDELEQAFAGQEAGAGGPRRGGASAATRCCSQFEKANR